MADTKDFDVIRVCRSDGADTGPGYWPLTAPAASTSKRPSAEKAPRAKPQMARLQEDDPRFTEWRVKLGILLKQELSPNPEGEIQRPPHATFRSDFVFKRATLGMCRSLRATGSTRNLSIFGCQDIQSNLNYSRVRKNLPCT